MAIFLVLFLIFILATLYFLIGLVFPRLPFVKSRGRAAVLTLSFFLLAVASGVGHDATMTPAQREAAQEAKRADAEKERASDEARLADARDRSAQSPSAGPSAGVGNGGGQSPLDMMVVAFDGSYTRDQIKQRLDSAMTLYGLALSDENYHRAGSALVALRKANGVSEMRILDYMIRSHVEGVNMTFPDAAGIASAVLKVGADR